MRLGLVVGLGLVSALGCSSSTTDAVALRPTLIAPQGVLDSVTRLSISVFDAAVATCNADGSVTGDTSKSLSAKDLGTANCANGAKFCGDLQIEPSSAPRTFQALGLTSDGKKVATGCAKAVIDKAASTPLSIKMFRLIPQAMCNGKPSPYKVVQCDAAGSATDPVCDAECLSKEQFLSHGSGNPGQTSSTKAKEKASFVWPSNGDPGVGRFIAFAGDQSQPTRRQVSMRVLDPDMAPCVGAKCAPDRGGFVQLNSFFIPNDPNNFDLSTQSGDPQSQYNPAAAYANNKYFVAFEDGTGNTSRIALRTIKPDISAEQPVGGPIALTMGNGQKRPAVAVSGGGQLLVVWEANGDIRGRTVDPNACTAMCTLGTEQLIGSGTRPSVAGTASGFVVTWQSGADVKLRALDAMGAGAGAEIKVNDATHSGNQDSPAVAALSSGTVGVIWHDSGNGGIFVQRYGAAPGLAPVANDQGKRINDLTASDPSDEPTIVAGSGAGGPFFAAAWVDRANGHVRARFLDATGFLYNPVDGQTSEFQATRADADPSARHNPAVAIGGTVPYVAIGWEDNSGAATSMAEKGILARRFPVPLK